MPSHLMRPRVAHRTNVVPSRMLLIDRRNMNAVINRCAQTQIKPTLKENKKNFLIKRPKTPRDFQTLNTWQICTIPYQSALAWSSPKKTDSVPRRSPKPPRTPFRPLIWRFMGRKAFRKTLQNWTIKPNMSSTWPACGSTCNLWTRSRQKMM